MSSNWMCLKMLGVDGAKLENGFPKIVVFIEQTCCDLLSISIGSRFVSFVGT